MNRKILAALVLILLIIAFGLQFIDLGQGGNIFQMILVATSAVLGFKVFGSSKNYQ